MAVYNTPADAANTAVRAFLTRIGEYYLGRSFNTSSGKASQDWIKIRDIVFDGKCAYCGKKESKLQMEHLIMFNRDEYGLHHPGNIVPVCNNCNKRSRDEKQQYKNWEEHLSIICERDKEINKSWVNRLKLFLGLKEQEILDHFYSRQTNLFGDAMLIKKNDPINKLHELYAKRIAGNIFKYVSNPKVLKNDAGSPLFHFFMATNNEIGLRIANSVINPKLGI